MLREMANIKFHEFFDYLHEFYISPKNIRP